MTGAQVSKGRYLVMTAGEDAGALAFNMAGETLWLAKVEHRGHDSLRLHYYQHIAQQPG